MKKFWIIIFKVKLIYLVNIYSSLKRPTYCLGLDDKHPASCWAREVIHPG